MSVDKHVDDLTWHSIPKHVPNVAPWNTVGDVCTQCQYLFHANASPVTRLIRLATSVLLRKGELMRVSKNVSCVDTVIRNVKL